MHPVLFDLWGLEIHTYGVLGALAFIVGCGIVLWRSHRLGWDLNAVADVVFWMAITGMIGARLVFVLQNPETVTTWRDLVDLRGGGLVFYGSFLLGIPVGLWWIRRAGLPAFAVWDLFGTAFPLSHAISRIGCFFAGCCYGLPSDGPFALTFPPGSTFAPSGPLHPTQLYEAGALLGIAGITNAFYPRRRFDGQVFLLYVLLYAAARTVTEVFRGDVSRGFFVPGVFGELLTYSQGVSIVFAAGALVLFSIGSRWSPPPTTPASAAVR